MKEFNKGGDVKAFTDRLSQEKDLLIDACALASEYVSANKDFYTQLDRADKLEKQYLTLSGRGKNVVDKFSAAAYSRNKSSRIAFQEIQSASKNLEEAHEAFQSNKKTEEDFSRDLKKFDLLYSSNKQTIENNGDAKQTITGRIGDLSKKFMSWFSVSQIIMSGVSSAKKMIDASIQVDTAMTELKKVTNETDATYSNFLDNASARAAKIGASLSDVVAATADFARIGYIVDEATKLADAASVYKNVGDDLGGIEDASKSIISTMQAFGMESGQAMSVVDKFNEVSNNYAISSGGLGEALQRSAAAMKAANNTLDETIALATAANTIVQNPEIVGTTLKTVSMYLRASKTDAEAAGESTEGMAESVSKLRDEILSLTGGKVDIMASNKEFKSTYQILKDLSGVWGELSDVSQANITSLVGGKRNANIVTALLENFNVAEKALGTASNSDGSAMKENERYLDSVKGKLDRLSASFQTFSADFMNSSAIKSAVDALTALLNVLDQIVNKLGALPLIGTAFGGISLFKKYKNFKKNNGNSNEFAHCGCESIVA